VDLSRLKSDRDYLFASILGTAAVIIVIIMIWNELTWLWSWFLTAGDNGSVWLAIWDFCKANLSILIVIYGLISLQASGLAELKFGKNFLKAFGLALILTPPIMMAVYGHRKKKKNSKEGT